MSKSELLPVAVIDIGSNSVRLMTVFSGKKIKKLSTTRLGEGLYKSGVIREDALIRTVNAVVDFYNEAKSLNIKNIYAFATAAVRNAKNGRDFVKAVKEKIPLDVDVISGEAEANLAFLGALYGKAGGVIDVGGASSEAVYTFDGVIPCYEKSMPVGAVKLRDGFTGEYASADKFLKEQVKIYGDVKNLNGEFYAVGGTATSLAAIDLKLKVYDPLKTDGHVLKTERLKEIFDELKGMTAEEITKTYAVDLKRAEIISYGTLIILNVLNYFNLSQITVSESDNLEGYLIFKDGGYEKILR